MFGVFPIAPFLVGSKNCEPTFERTLRKLDLHFISNRMGCDGGDSIPVDFEPNGTPFSFPFDFELDGIPFGSENRKENCHHDHIAFNLEGNGNLVLSAYVVSGSGCNSWRTVSREAGDFLAIIGVSIKASPEAPPPLFPY